MCRNLPWEKNVTLHTWHHDPLLLLPCCQAICQPCCQPTCCETTYCESTCCSPTCLHLLQHTLLLALSLWPVPTPKTLASSWSGDSCCSLAVQSYTLPFADHPHDPTWKPKECEFLFKCVKCLEKRWSSSPFLSTPVVMNFVPSLWVANVKVWYQLKILSQDIYI